MAGAAVRRDLIVVGASAGGVEALKRFVSQLPYDLPAAVLIVLHVWSEGRSVLPQILDEAGPLPAFHPDGGDPIEYGRIYVAPPDFHMMVRNGHIELMRGPKENRHRPAVDPLFRSAALGYGPRVTGIILTGTMDDGAAGLLAIKRRGGVTIVQDPANAEFSGMPVNAIDTAPVDYILRLAEIPAKAVHLAGQATALQSVSPFGPNSGDRKGIRYAEANMETIENDQGHPGQAVRVCLPGMQRDAVGSKRRPVAIPAPRGARIFCRRVIAGTVAAIEEALWTAFRATEEAAAMHRRIAERARGRRARRDGRRAEP